MRESMTLGQFKAHIMLCIKSKLEEGRRLQGALSLSLAGLLSKEAAKHAKEFNESLDNSISDMDRELEFLFSSKNPSPVERKQQAEEDKLRAKQVKVLQMARKLDAAMAKFTGRKIDSPWSVGDVSGKTWEEAERSATELSEQEIARIEKNWEGLVSS